jgi:transcriptional regulator with AAA-type ATPase domain
LLITGKPGCEQEELARIIHRISKRRELAPIEIDGVPADRRTQSQLLKQRATRGTLVLNLGKNRSRLDPGFVSSMFSPGYNIRVIVIARTATQARRALGHSQWRELMHVALCPMEQRRGAIARLLDQFLAARDSVLRMADLTPRNQRALLHNAWRENLIALREAAVRLDAMVRAGFSRKGAAAALGIHRQTFDHWFNNTMRLATPLVTDTRKRALIAALAAREPAPT